MRRAHVIGIALALTACRDDEHASGERSDSSSDAGSSTAAHDSSESGAATDASEDGDSGSTGGGEESAVDEARRDLPTYLALHDVVISRTCTPNEGVCHNDKEYPDLHTPQAMLAAIDLPCNLVVKDPLETFDGCERAGDEVAFLFGPNDGFTTEIAWSEIDAESGELVITLRDEIPQTMDDPAVPESVALVREYSDAVVTMVELYGAVFYDGHEVRMPGVQLYGPELLEVVDDLHAGDPNRNGLFGADEAGFTLLAPGDPTASYLLGRVQGIVPGTPMPLANQPLSSAEMIALTCWIEGLGDPAARDVYAAIDYDACEAAEAFGQPDPDSGHSFAANVQPIFTQYCAAAGCHGGDVPAMNLDLSEGRAYESLTHTASQDPEAPLVEPGNPTHSYVMIKLWSKGITGLQMPRGPNGEGEPLPEEHVATIERWIVAGAPND